MNAAIVDCLIALRGVGGCELYAYCLMPDHLHFLAAPVADGASVLGFAHRFKSVSTRVAWQHHVRGRLWQPRFYDHVVRDTESLSAICDYILDNPLRAGLVASREQYRWSALVDAIR